MKVLVVGSLHHPEVQAQQDNFIAACRELGTALARAACDIVVGSDSPNTADRYVVEAAMAVPGKRTIWVLYPESEKGGAPFKDRLGAGGTETQFRHCDLKGPWVAARIPQVLKADAILAIGGGPGTVQAGYVAVSLERPVLAIPSFGGAARELAPILEPFYSGSEDLKNDVTVLRNNWGQGDAERAVRVIREARRRKLFHRDSWVIPLILLTCNVLGLAGWVWLFVSPPFPQAVAFFAMLGLAAFVGTTGLRYGLGRLSGDTEDRPVSRLLAEVSAGILLAFGLAVVYLIGGFTVTGKFEFISSTTQPGDFQRVGLAMTVLGLAGGWMIEPVSERLRAWFQKSLP
jgi:hypothetical protein